MKQVTLNNGVITLKVLDYGALIQELWVPDAFGKKRNVVVGFHRPTDYLADQYCLGASVGRFAGRISGKGFELEGTFYPLHHKNGVHLHGGKEGFQKKYWQIAQIDEGQHPFIELTYLSKDMEEGYPGNLKASVRYQLIENALHISYSATTDKTTIVNLTNHSYFKLDSAPTIAEHLLKLNSTSFLETHANLLPTGNILSVSNTSYDFRMERPIGEPLFDTPMVLENNKGFAAELTSTVSGITMGVSTDQPAMVVYTPKRFSGICFETQNFPDAPNHRHFPSAVLRPGDVYRNETKFVFGRCS